MSEEDVVHYNDVDDATVGKATTPDKKVQFWPPGSARRAFLVLSILETLGVMVLASLIIATGASTTQSVATERNLAITTLVVLPFYFYFSIHGIYKSNKLEVIICFVAVILVAAFAIFIFVSLPSVSDSSVSVSESGASLEAVWISSLVAMIFSILFAIGFAVVLPYLFKTWEEWRFRRVAPALQEDPKLLDLYRVYEALQAFTILDVQFAIILVVLGFFFFFRTVEIVVGFLMLVLTVIWAVVGIVAVRFEKKGAMIFFLVFSLLEPAYIIFLLYQYFTDDGTQFAADLPDVQVIGVCIFGLISRVLVIYAAIRQFHNFGKGLATVYAQNEEDEPALTILTEERIKPYLTMKFKKLRTRPTAQEAVQMDPMGSSAAPVAVEGSMGPPAMEAKVPVEGGAVVEGGMEAEVDVDAGGESESAESVSAESS